MINIALEFTGIPLEGMASKFIRIPLSIILDDEMDARRVGVLSYLKCRCGIDNIVNFSVPDIVEWCGAKPNKGANGTNNKFLNIIDALNDRGYLTYLNEPSRSAFMKCEFDSDKYEEECKRFAVVYLDELNKILNYKKTNTKDAHLTNTTILLVFAFLRANIIRRRNQIEYTTGNLTNDIKERRLKEPEAYNDNLKNISNELGISQQTLAKVLDILEHELKLIVTDEIYRIKNDKGEFRTMDTIFANAYKRLNNELLATGEEYSRAEIEAKVEKMKQNTGLNLIINKDKRKGDK